MKHKKDKKGGNQWQHHQWAGRSINRASAVRRCRVAVDGTLCHTLDCRIETLWLSLCDDRVNRDSKKANLSESENDKENANESESESDKENANESESESEGNKEETAVHVGK